MSAVMAICATSGCRRLYYNPDPRVHHCPAHQTERDRQDNARRNTHVRRLVYDHQDWPTTRAIVFKRDGSTCVDCGYEHYAGKGLVADHDPESIAELFARLGIEHGLRAALDPDSCVTRCDHCSGVKDGARTTSTR